MDVDALVKKVQEEFVKRVKTIDGFVDYYVIDGGDGTGHVHHRRGNQAGGRRVDPGGRSVGVVEAASDLVEGRAEMTTGEVLGARRTVIAAARPQRRNDREGAAEPTLPLCEAGL